MQRLLFLLFLVAYTFAFSWSNCGSSSDPTKVISLSVSPDPVKLGANIVLSAKVFLSTNITEENPVTVSLSISKEIFGVYIPVPCFDNIGSCTYNNICSLLDTLNATCPDPIKKAGIPCKCPFISNTYELSNFSFFAPNPNLNWLTDGNFKAEINVKSTSGSLLLCLQAALSISEGSILQSNL